MNAEQEADFKRFIHIYLENAPSGVMWIRRIIIEAEATARAEAIESYKDELASDDREEAEARERVIEDMADEAEWERESRD